MVQKVFAIGSIAALAGLVAMPACTTTLVTTLTDFADAAAAAGDAGKKPSTSRDPDPDAAGGTSSGGIADAAADSGPVTKCPASTVYTPDLVKPPMDKQNVCTLTVLNALAQACAEDPGGQTDDTCQKARDLAGNKLCAGCVFGEKSDVEWKVILHEQGATPPATYNQAGCVEHITAVPGCGAKYTHVSDCIASFCGDCVDAQDFGDCNATVLAGQCVDYGLEGACGDAYNVKRQQISDNCFPKTQDAAGLKALFVKIATVSCMSP